MWRRFLILALLLFAQQAHAQGSSTGYPAINGQCGGDLTGTYPNCQVNATHLGSALSAGQGGTGNATGQPSGTAGGDLGGSYPSPTAPGMQRRLGVLRGANFNSTADQAISITSTVTKYTVTAVYVTNCTGSLTLAVGGVYNATSKGGTAVVLASQAYSALSSATILLNTTLGASVATALLTSSTLYLSLTTGAGVTATCDVYIFGADLT